MKKIVSALLVLFLLTAWTGPIRAADDIPIAPEPDIVTTCAELSQWAESHSTVGGTVYLGADILWEKGVPLITTAPIIVEMGPYSITVSKDAALNLADSFVFCGISDADGKLFLVEEGGTLFLNAPVIIQAQGNGVTAVRVMWPNGLQNGYATVSAYGEGSVAVDAPNGLETTNGIYHAEGPNAIAISGGGPVKLIYCETSAVGEGAAAIRVDGPIILDTTYTSPSPETAEVVERVFDASDYFKTRGWISSLYLAPGETLSLPASLPASLLSPGGDKLGVRPDVVWDTSLVETDTPGQYSCTGKLVFPLEKIPLQGAEPLEAHVYVVDRQLPHLILYKETAPGRGTLGQLDPVSPTAERELWGSADGGDTWAQIPIDELSVALHEVSFISPFNDGCNSYQFMLVVRDGDNVMSSNILDVNYTSDGIYCNDIGGERQGTDRGAGIERPSNPDVDNEPEPTPTPEATPVSEPSAAPFIPSDMDAAAGPAATDDTPQPSVIEPPYVAAVQPAPTPVPTPVSSTPAPSTEPSPSPSAGDAAISLEPEAAHAPPSASPPIHLEPAYPLIRLPSFGAVAGSLILIGIGVLIGVLSRKRRKP